MPREVFKLKDINIVGGTFKISIKSACRIIGHTNYEVVSGIATCIKRDRGDVSAMMAFAAHEDQRVASFKS